MKIPKSISTIVLLAAMAGCTGGGKQSAGEIVTVDVNGNYPEKELVLQNFMDVEYIPLETTDEFITQGVVKAIGEEVVIVANRVGDGDIFVFDRATGKGLRKINRQGQGPEEYARFTEIVLDEDNDEMFVVAYSERNILVYDLHGNFKRSFKFAGEASYFNNIFDYDRDCLICYNSFMPGIETEQSAHLLVSKHDGSITREIRLPFNEIETPVYIDGELSVSPGFFMTVPNGDGWVVMRTSSDTIYNFLPGGNPYPIAVRTPSIQSMDPEIFLFPTVVADRYFFMRTMKKVVDLKTFKGFPSTDLVYDKQEKALFEYTALNDDFSNKQAVSLGQKPGSTVNRGVASCESLNASDLVTANEEGRLKGRLQEIAAALDEESNPVVMLIKHRK